MKIKWKRCLSTQNYKKQSLFLGCCYCDWKCCRENNLPESNCWNNELYKLRIRDVPNWKLFNLYNQYDNKAIVIGGFEPFLQFDEIKSLIVYFRNNGCNDEFVIYTGYYAKEIADKIEELKQYGNIIIKFGRFIPNSKGHYEPLLGIKLSSPNQYAEKIC